MSFVVICAFCSVHPISASEIKTRGSLEPKEKLCKEKPKFDQLLTMRQIHWVNEFIDTISYHIQTFSN